MGNDRRSETVAAGETHISRLFFTPDRVYKILKPVDLPFLNLVDADDRLRAATVEFDLNHRFAPDVYLGTADVDEGGVITDRMLVMRRLPEDRQLNRILTSPNAKIKVWETAKHLATLHASEPPITDQRSEAASAETLAQRWTENLEALEPFVGSTLDRSEFEAVTTLVDTYIDGRRQLFADRVADGWVRDGHGDLRAEHVFCLDDGPRLIDCLAFREDFRIGDVLNDVAFLVMDIQRLAGPELARSLIHDYCEFTYEHHPSTLAHHYVAYRAHVRAKIAALRFADGDESALEDLLTYHHLAHHHLSVGRVRVILVGGSVGVGKSTVARSVAGALGATWLRTDEVRKAGGGPEPASYEPEAQDAVYRNLLDQAEALLVRGESVVLDATWSSNRHRRWARELAERTRGELASVRVTAPLEVACARLRIRGSIGDDPSDATPELARQLDGRFEAWPDATAVSSDRTITETVDEALRSVVEQRNERPTVDGRRSDPAAVANSRIELDDAAVRFYLRRAGTRVPGPEYLGQSG